MSCSAAKLCLATFSLFVLINSDLLDFSPKFTHNKGYKVVQERADMIYVNKSLGQFSIKVFVYNRTVKALNMTMCFFRKLTDESMMFVSGYQFKSNQYKLTAIQFPVKIREMLQIQWFGLDLFASNAVPPIKWPLNVNVTYRIINWYPDSKFFPFGYNSLGKWKGNVVWYMDDRKGKLFEYDYYICIEEHFY